ncbi:MULTISPECIES: serine O-acetyltransferase [Pseudorhizobium]|uniref:Serine acetyltransferase n=1 Tax=Pseudorhizobium pelagicum TaxID=1509405 RepID=A0A922P0I0_9HYPH|nr:MULTISPECIES: serine O-acetyltransferase [Pseudorhizobium]MBA4786393.1 serine O-acetyltransferase [Hyphomicrobiales bacterium]MBU1315301.1 serine O-acetyltransferase [Alphaproteobacteria bacterium]MDY6962647.1 serine O-acetyltransferase [Pseudomonadota bacterium]KEQ08011.1 serine acetyltransferase [Pseudorhizobium pelagicum]KEQ10208.1 serine acetyltransferase [Pseudorhizobium pelagicum]|tara:strand:+ start:8184 stop:9008 length:825 start_codon:yes stop_codon:yes gene_type:complete
MAARTEIRPNDPVASVDPIWDTMRQEARAAADSDPLLAAFLYSTVLNHRSLEDSVIHRICERLDHADLQAVLLRQTFAEMLADWPEWGSVLRVDIQAVYDRDPACLRFLEPVLYFKGFHAIQTHRLAHWLLSRGRRDFALYLQSRASSVFQTDINPAARIGKGIFLDHATGLVVGETAVIGDNVSILHGVTLGGTGKEGAERHPKIANGVLIGAGAKILGNIEIGSCSRVAAGSVVLKPVPPKTTVAGVPAKVVGEAGCSEPARLMDQLLSSDE